MGTEAMPTATDRHFLLALERLALQYFLDNQTPSGLFLDRQSNRGPLRAEGLCSTSATGMGWIALALASADPHRLLSAADAVGRIRAGLETALFRLPHDRGVVPHFLDARTGCPRGSDHFSTIDTAWLAAGALWASAFLHDAELTCLAQRIAERIDWHYWTAPGESDVPLVRHGQTREGHFLRCTWDRLNGETVFMYVLAAGSEGANALPASAWRYLRPFPGSVAGLRFNNSDLGLFVFQYGLDLLDLSGWLAPGGVDLAMEAPIAAEANYRLCRELADTYETYRDYWGLSAGDGPADTPSGYTYRCYAPAGPIDGTAHLTATLASISHQPDVVLANLHRAEREERRSPLGRYGFSSVNRDRGWIASDMVGIDAGAAVLAVENYLNNQRIRRIFHSLPCVQRGLKSSGFRRRIAYAA